MYFPVPAFFWGGKVGAILFPRDLNEREGNSGLEDFLFGVILKGGETKLTVQLGVVLGVILHFSFFLLFFVGFLSLCFFVLAMITFVL